MFADLPQLLVMGVVIVLMLLWGSKKMPDLADVIGRTGRGYAQASQELTDAVPGKSPLKAAFASADQTLVNLADKLALSPAGKTSDQISQETVARAGGNRSA